MNEILFQEKRIDQRQYVQCPTQISMEYVGSTPQSLNFSDGGIRLQLSEPVRISMRVKIGDHEDDRQANLVWARKNVDGKMELGLQYPEESATNQMDNNNEKLLSPTEKASPKIPTQNYTSIYPPNSFWRLRW
ncbi:MAG: PilZ domain-containing protein [Candidatus Riflebacteria bacterium]|nr:PilZ domain-containing protein [Candidatus Riflebacteria bacterium]